LIISASAGSISSVTTSAHRCAIAAEWRERAVSLAFLDMILPGFGLENAVRFGPDGFGLWHLAFHAATEVPEMLIAGREREYLGWFFRHHAATPTAIPAEDIEVYAPTTASPPRRAPPWDFIGRSTKVRSRIAGSPRAS
jgi:hypothetical protein